MYYGAPVLFNQDCISLSFDNNYLEHPVVQNEASVENYVRRAPLDIYLPLNAAGDVSLEVRKQIQDMLTKTHFPLGLQELATRMQLNPQTLRRQLQREGSSYNSIKTQVRRDIAMHHLGRGETSIETIAEKVGYTEPSAFIRAFKAWTGFTPLQFKKGLNLHDID
jgi:AraC-like DNA-binding protein